MAPPALMPRPGSHNRSLALLGCLCLFLSAVEYLIPKPLPFMRIGLANLPLLLALNMFGPIDFFTLVLLKVLGQGIVGGTLFSYVFLFSLAGTCASAILMYILRGLLKQNLLGCAGLGCAGAMASNGVQLILARYLIFGDGLRYLIPPFLASGLVTGIALGLFCEYFSCHSIWYRRHTRFASGIEPPQAALCTNMPPVLPQAAAQNAEQRRRRGRRWDNLFNVNALCIAGFFMAVIFLCGRSLPGRAAQFVFFCLLARLAGRKNNVLITFTIMAGIVFFNLLIPYGKVLAVLGPLRITRGSLLAGLEKAVTLEGLIMLSRVCVTGDLRLPGGLGSLLSESLRMLAYIQERKSAIRRDNIIAGIDALLLELETAGIDATVNTMRQKTKPAAVVLLSGMVLITAVAGLVPHMVR